MILPSLKTKTRLQSSTVLSLWAIDTDVLLASTGVKFLKTIFSVSASSALVNSSKRYNEGFFTKHRDKAILCFWPPEICPPFSPTSLFKPRLKPSYLRPILG